MSLKSELQEVVDWLSDLTTESGAAPQPVYHEDWNLVRDNLKRAREHFHAAIAALQTKHSSLVDFARDLERETEGLRLRAQLLAGRAPKKPPVGDATTVFVKQLEEKQNEPDATKKELHDVAQQLEAAKHTETPKEAKEPGGPSDFANDAAQSLESAHRHVLKDGDAPPDVVADAFANRLDLLSEMTLSLRLQLEDEEEGARQPPAEGE
jgi:hypothetical protein